MGLTWRTQQMPTPRVTLFAIGLAAATCVALPARAQKAGPAAGETLSESYRGSQRDNLDYQKIAPIRIFDNLYYVGPGFVSVWLIPTTDGLILVDSAQEPYVDHVIENIRKAGFDPRNVKYILVTHGHLDHFGGAARIQALSSARVAMLDEDWRLIESAPPAGNAARSAPPLTRDMVIKEGDVVTLGTTAVKVYKLPGHTPGSASFELTVYDGGRPHKAFVFGGPGQRNGVDGGTQFLASIERLQREFADVEVPVHVHSWLSTYPYPGAIFERAQNLAQRKPGQPHPFVDNAAWRQWLKTAHAGTLKYIEDAKAGRPVR